MSEEKKEQVEQEENVEEATAEEVEKTEKQEETQQDEVNEQKMIPYWRFKEVVDEKNELNDQLKELQNKIENMDDPEEIKEQMKQENEKLEKRNKDFLKTSEVKVKAISEGIRKEALDDFIKVVDIDKLEVDEDNNVLGVDELIQDAKENKSFYFGEKETKGKTAGDFHGKQKNEESTEDWAKRIADKFKGI